MRKVLISILMILIGWDVITTYYGTLSIFVYSEFGQTTDIIKRIKNAEVFIHLIALVFAIGLIVFILAYRIILNSKNKITLGILGIAFIYDFATSFYGTAQAAKLITPNAPQLAILFLFAVMCTAAPLLIGQIYEDAE